MDEVPADAALLGPRRPAADQYDGCTWVMSHIGELWATATDAAQRATSSSDARI